MATMDSNYAAYRRLYQGLKFVFDAEAALPQKNNPGKVS
jgi:hypothetical protein